MKRFWTNHEVNVLREMYPTHDALHVANALNWTVAAVYNKAHELGLKRRLSTTELDARRYNLQTHGVKTRFAKGNRSWNKGRKGIAQPGSEKTFFKPGHVPHTWRPVGHEVIRDGNLCRKVTDQGPSQKRFRPVHVLVWEAVHGPVPKGYVVAFRLGMHTLVSEDITPNRLELLTRKQLMARNTIHNYPAELKQSIRLVKRLRRRIQQKQGKQA